MSEETMERGAEETFELPPERTGAAGYQDDDEALTPDEFEKLVSGVTHPAGDYILGVADVVDTAPTEEKNPGGLTVKFFVKTPPPGAVPKSGTWEGLQVTFRTYLKATATDKNKTSERIDKQDMGALLKGLGLAVAGADGKIRPKQALMAGAKGRLILASIEHDKYQGRTQQRVKNFRPIAG